MKTIAFTLLLLSLRAFGSTYYVDLDSGNDSNSGTATNAAWRTIPGTRTTNNSGYLNSAWGSVTTSSRLGSGTEIILKGGTTHNSSDGGFVWLTSASGGFYTDDATNYDAIAIRRSTNWGSGQVVFDASGFTNTIAVILNQMSGFTLDGGSVDGIVIRNGAVCGSQTKEKAGASDSRDWITYRYVRCETNGTSIATDADGAGVGAITVHRGAHVRITDCNVDGGQQYSQGVLLGETDWTVTDAVVSGCRVWNLKGDPEGTDDSGIGFKSYNSQAIWTNVVSHNNQKGFDVGQEGPSLGSFNITNLIINSTVASNYTGINSPGTSQKPYTGNIELYVINTLVTSNAYHGMRTYQGPHQAYVVHSVFDNNGSSPPSGTYAGHIRYDPDAASDTNRMVIHVRNSIFRQGYEHTLLVFNYIRTNNDLTIDTDYNSYDGSNGAAFCKWSVNAGSDTYAQYDYGTNGPGWASGSWYTNACSVAGVSPARGTGHLGSDAHSFSTGGSNTNLPSLNSNYGLSTHFAGANLSSTAWYLSCMGVDRAGITRQFWDLGMFEYQAPITIGTATVGTLNAP